MVGLASEGVCVKAYLQNSPLTVYFSFSIPFYIFYLIQKPCISYVFFYILFMLKRLIYSELWPFPSYKYFCLFLSRCLVRLSNTLMQALSSLSNQLLRCAGHCLGCHCKCFMRIYDLALSVGFFFMSQMMMILNEICCYKATDIQQIKACP